MKIIQGIPQNKITNVLDYTHQFFDHVMDATNFYQYMRYLANVNWDESILLVDDENNIKGAYIFGSNQINYMVDAKDYKGLKGVEGVLLCIDKSLRGQGYGNQMKEYPKTLGYDYIWGQQFRAFGNLKDWLKRRELVGETEYVYITAEKFV
jgi:hypothetical protein